MKFRFSLLFLWVVSGLSLSAQDAYQQWLEQALQAPDEKVQPPHKSFSLKNIDAYRRQVWQAWCAANAQLVKDENFGTPLPAPDSLNLAVPHSWKLPEELEPHAVMPFYFGAKGVCPSAGYPFFLYLHGSGPKEMEWQTGLKLALAFQDAPALYFIPQIPNEQGWYRWWQRSKQYAWEQLFRQLLLRPDVNPRRLYLFGISEGGYGSQRLASFYADYLAAAGPMAAGEPLKNAPAENLSNIGFYLRTGAEDGGFYRNKLSRYTAEALDSLENLYSAGYRHRVELIPGKGHHIDYSKTTPWLLHFERNPWPKCFTWEDYEMDGRHRNGFYNLLVLQRPDSLLRTRYDVMVEDNQINIVVENVEYECVETDPVYGIELKFHKTYTPAEHGRIICFLHEQLVNLRQTVVISLNGREVYRGIPKLSTVALLRSAIAFGDPERLFPAAIEIGW